MDWNVFLPKPYVESLILNVTVFGNVAFKEVIKVNWSHKGRP